MHPVLFTVGTYAVSAYVALHWAGIVLAVVTAAWLAARRGLPVGRTAAVLAIAGVGSFVGARALSAALNPATAAAHPETFLGVRMGAFHLEGALIVGVAVGAVTARALGMELAALGDVAAIAVGLRIVLLRIGCFLAGCCFGVETALPWGVTFPTGSHAWAWHLTQGGPVGIGDLLAAGTPPPAVHPTELYEAAAALLAAGLAWWLHRRRVAAGTPALVAAITFLAFRAVDWQLRAPTYEAPQWVLVAISLACAMVCLASLVARGQRVLLTSGRSVPGVDNS